MARALSKKLSGRRVSRYSRRHVRMAVRTKNEEAIAIAKRTEAPRAELDAKIEAAELAETAVEDAFDNWVADDREVDGHVGTVARKTEDYDAEHPGARTQHAVLQGQRPSDITRINRAEQPNTIVKIVQRASALPPDHPALPVVTLLSDANERTRESQRAHALAVTAKAAADAAVEVAKLAVIQVYRDNIIDITRAVGEELAERCFPQVAGTRKKKGGGGGDDGEG